MTAGGVMNCVIHARYQYVHRGTRRPVDVFDLLLSEGEEYQLESVRCRRRAKFVAVTTDNGDGNVVGYPSCEEHVAGAATQPGVLRVIDLRDGRLSVTKVA